MIEHTSFFGESSESHQLTGCSVKDTTRDANAKRLLKYRVVLANLLKYAIPKYNNYSLDDIIRMIPASSRTPDGFYVQEDNPEDFEDSKHIDFDVLFHTEDDAEKVSIWCDIEPQSEYMTKTNRLQSYDLSARGVYYLSRMISRQLSTGTELSGYRHLKKCYSIWICFDKLDNLGWNPVVTRYSFQPVTSKDENTPSEQEKNAADLMELIIIRAGGNAESPDGEASLVGLVNTLWRDTSCLSKYIPKGRAEYNVVSGEVSDMCDMREVGKAEGIALGEAKIINRFIDSLMRKGFSPSQVKLELIDKLELSSDDAEAAYNKYVKLHQL